MRDGEVRGTVPWATAPPSRRYAPGRVCAEPACDTRLSIYNSGDRCALHTLAEPTGVSRPAA